MWRIKPITSSPIILYILRLIRVQRQILQVSRRKLLNRAGGGGWEFKECGRDDSGGGLLDPKEISFIKLGTF